MFAKQPIWKVSFRDRAMRTFGFDRLYNESIVRIPATGETDFMPAYAELAMNESAKNFGVEDVQ